MKTFSIIKVAYSIDEAVNIIKNTVGKSIQQITIKDGYETTSYGIVCEKYEIEGTNDMISILFKAKVIREVSKIQEISGDGAFSIEF